MKESEYFFDKAGDARMEEQNKRNWNQMLGRVRYAGMQNWLPEKPWNIVDIGCHTGGLLTLCKEKLRGRVSTLTGVEPLPFARKKAQQLLDPGGRFVATTEEIDTLSMDVVLCHEVLYLVEDLDQWMHELKRIVSGQGGAFVALGSHGENTAWLRWREKLEHKSFVHQPMDILKAGSKAGFYAEVCPLRKSMFAQSIRYSPPTDGWGEFTSVEEMQNFYEKWKYLFIFYPR